MNHSALAKLVKEDELCTLHTAKHELGSTFSTAGHSTKYQKLQCFFGKLGITAVHVA